MMRTGTAAVQVLVILIISPLVTAKLTKSDRCDYQDLPQATKKNAKNSEDQGPIFSLVLTQGTGNGTQAGSSDYVVDIVVTGQILTFKKALIKVSAGRCGHGSFRHNFGDYFNVGSKSCPEYQHVKKDYRKLRKLPPLEWTPPKCGCVEFRATVIEESGLVYGDPKDASRGHLLKTVCFQGRVEREVYAKALCKGNDLYSAMAMAQKSQSTYAIGAFTERKSHVAECCDKKSQGDILSCLEVVRARRINKFCQTGEPDLTFTPMRRRHMMEKMDECCYFLGRRLYHCFEEKSALELNERGSTFLDYSMDEFNPLNDLARFLSLRDMDSEIYDMLSPAQFNLKPSYGELSQKAMIIAEATVDSSIDTAKSLDAFPVPAAAAEASSVGSSNVERQSSHTTGQRGDIGTGGRSNVQYKDQPGSRQSSRVGNDYRGFPQKYDEDDVGLVGNQEIGQTSAEIEDVRSTFTFARRVLNLKENCCIRGMKITIEETHNLKGACRKASEEFASDGEMGEECQSMFFSCCWDHVRNKKLQNSRSSRLERRVDSRGIENERGDALDMDPKDHSRQHGSSRNLRRDLVDDFDKASETRYQSMGRSGERRVAQAEEDEDEEEQDGPARFDSVDNEDEQNLDLRGSREGALLSRNRNRALTERKTRPKTASEEMTFDDRTLNSRVRDDDDEEEEEDEVEGAVDNYASMDRRVIERKNNFAQNEILRSHPDQRSITRTLPRSPGPYRTVQDRNSVPRKGRASKARNSRRRSGENRMSRRGKSRTSRRNRSSRRSRNSRRRTSKERRSKGGRASRRRSSRRRSSRRRNSKARSSRVRYSDDPRPRRKNWLYKAIDLDLVPLHLDSREMNDYGRRNRKGAYDSKEMRLFHEGLRYE